MVLTQTSISTINQKSFNHKHRIGGTYLHGSIEIAFGHDIFSFDDEEFPTADGIHQFEILNMPTTLFLWSDLEYEKYTGRKKRRGLLVFNHDNNAFEDAYEKYSNTNTNL